MRKTAGMIAKTLAKRKRELENAKGKLDNATNIPVRMRANETRLYFPENYWAQVSRVMDEKSLDNIGWGHCHPIGPEFSHFDKDVHGEFRDPNQVAVVVPAYPASTNWHETTLIRKKPEGSYESTRNIFTIG